MNQERHQEIANRPSARRLRWLWAQYPEARGWGLRSSFALKPWHGGPRKEMQSWQQACQPPAGAHSPRVFTDGSGAVMPLGPARCLALRSPLPPRVPSWSQSMRVLAGDCLSGRWQYQGGSHRQLDKGRLKEKGKCLQNLFLLSHYLSPDHLLSKKESLEQRKCSSFITYQLCFITTPLWHVAL